VARGALEVDVEFKAILFPESIGKSYEVQYRRTAKNIITD
jgi:hypothetical protein